MILNDRAGEPLQKRGGDVEYRYVRRLIKSGTPIIELHVDRPVWIEDATAWWSENAQQVETKDHPAAGPWPQNAAYAASIWFSSAGRVLVFNVHC